MIGVRQQEFIELSEALERGIITLEQFKVMCKFDDIVEIRTMLKLMKLEFIEDKDKILNEVAKLRNKKEICDRVRQFFLDCSFDSNGFLWNNKTIAERLKENFDARLNDDDWANYCAAKKNEYIKKLLFEIKRDTSLYEQDGMLELISEIFNFQIDYIDDYFKFLKIEEFRTQKFFMDFMYELYVDIKKYLYSNENFYCYRSYQQYNECYKDYVLTLNSINMRGYFGIVSKKMSEINGSDKTEKDKKIEFFKVLEVLTAMCHHVNYDFNYYEDKEFEFLVKYLSEPETNYRIRLFIDEGIRTGKMSIDEVMILIEGVTKIQNRQVRDYVYWLLLKDKSILDKNTLERIIDADSEEVNLIILKKVIKDGNADCVQSCLFSGYKGAISSKFKYYLEDGSLTKEEVFMIKDKINRCSNEILCENNGVNCSVGVMIEQEKEHVKSGLIKRLIPIRKIEEKLSRKK